MNRNRSFHRFVLAAFAVAGLLALPLAALCQEEAPGGQLSLSFEKDLLSLDAADVPLKTLLAALADRAHLQIFLGEDVQNQNVSFHLDRVRLEKALSVILADYNYMASFRDEEGVSQISSLRIFPKGKSGGRLVPLEREAVVTTLGGGVADEGGGLPPMEMPTEGVIAPAPPVAVGENPEGLGEGDMALVALEQQYRDEKTALFQQQVQTNELIKGATDPEQKLALEQIAAELAEKSLILDQKFTNQIESRKRIQDLEQALGANPAGAEAPAGQEVSQ